MLQVLCAWSLQVKLPRRAVLLLLLGCSRQGLGLLWGSSGAPQTDAKLL